MTTLTETTDIRTTPAARRHAGAPGGKRLQGSGG